MTETDILVLGIPAVLIYLLDLSGFSEVSYDKQDLYSHFFSLVNAPEYARKAALSDFELMHLPKIKEMGLVQYANLYLSRK